jgi:RNA polymerase sigma factor (sigma-70 family)
MSRPRVEDLDLEVVERALLDPRGPEFVQLYDRYDPLVRWAVGHRVLRWPELTSSFDDIVQDVWLQLLRHRGRRWLGYDPGRGIAFGSFLALIAGRYGWKLAKRRLRHPLEPLRDEPDDADWDFTLALVRTDVLQRLAEQVDALDERSRRFFHGHYVEGRLIKDVGGELGLSDNTAHVFKLRLEKKLAAMAEALLSEAPDAGTSNGTGRRLVVVTLVALVALATREGFPLAIAAHSGTSFGGLGALP